MSFFPIVAKICCKHHLHKIVMSYSLICLYYWDLPTPNVLSGSPCPFPFLPHLFRYSFTHISESFLKLVDQKGQWLGQRLSTSLIFLILIAKLPCSKVGSLSFRVCSQDSPLQQGKTRRSQRTGRVQLTHGHKEEWCISSREGAKPPKMLT